MRRPLLILYLFSREVETCTASICPGHDPCSSISQTKDGTRQEPAIEGEHDFSVREGRAQSMPLCPDPVVRETRAGQQQ
jgi:hypothetical protein